MSKNVAVFVDVANIFYAAKAAGVDIDYVTLLKASSAGRDLVRAYAYTGLDPENENQRNFHDFLRRHGYKVVSKDIRKYGDGKVKANLDIELVVDMMKTARNLDIAIVVSGDGDFAPAIRAVQEMGVRVEVVSFRGNTSSDLIDVADIFTDITQIAKVEKGSARSGRRVADDDEDLSMTEVPDKMTEGTGDGRRRGRGTRTRSGEAAVGRSSTSRATTSRARTSTARAAAKDAVVADGTLVALPGEKLSRAGRAAAAASEAEDAVQPDLEPDEGLAVDGEIDAEGAEGAEGADVVGAEGDAPHRRRRRRGGRGRGRGRGRELEAPAEGVGPVGDAEDFEEPEPLPAPRRQAFSFGSVWDSQLGKAPAAASGGSGLGPIEEDEDLEEPAIPEYLLAERRNRDGARRGGRGGGPGRRGGAYAAALERERFGGGRGSTTSRFADPQQRHRDAGAGRAPARGPMGRGYERSEPRTSSSEPWSEVPPEIEAMLRAQMAGSGRSTRPRPEAGEGATATAVPGREGPAEKPAARSRAAAKPRASRSSSATSEGTTADAGSPVEAAAKPATRARRTTKAGAAAGTPRTAVSTEAEPAAAPKRARRPKAAAEAGDATVQPSAEPAAAPKRRTTRRTPAATD